MEVGVVVGGGAGRARLYTSQRNCEPHVSLMWRVVGVSVSYFLDFSVPSTA